MIHKVPTVPLAHAVRYLLLLLLLIWSTIHSMDSSMSLCSYLPTTLESYIDLSFLKALSEYDHIKPYYVSGALHVGVQCWEADDKASDGELPSLMAPPSASRLSHGLICKSPK